MKGEKEVKKVNRPYFETEVVKVKKENNKCKHLNAPCIHTYIYNGVIRCPQCGKILTPEWLKKRIIIPLLVKEKGNWVNGENLDKIKFPVPCSYTHGTKKMGMLLKLGDSFYIINIDGQGNYTKYFLSYDLKHLIEDFDIHILKGKIIIFEEEK